MSFTNTDQLSPGVTVEVRDEQWLVTGVARSTDGFRLKVRGLSDYVRDSTATFYTALDEVRVFDPTQVEVTPDDSPGYRHARLWIESTLRQTPIPLYQRELSVATRMLADPLDYQLSAVRRALSAENTRPRILLADAVGLGKTLEIGMILAELIRRGRGQRILVVTPKHVMEQFQQELWTRFSIPLVRLDSVGIQQVRQKLPASRNPFTYYPRVIVSMDTLKSPKYRAQLEKVSWDAVVIDEIHNATNAGTKNNELARTLAPTTESLILASATPHNGNPNSFKEILRLLDPLSVLPDGRIDADAAKRLIIRRHRNTPEVAQVVGSKWAKRLEPHNIPVDASPEENAVARELHQSWTHPGSNAVSKDRLFPWTLTKAYLSSPAALAETVAGRLSRITPGPSSERQALEHLAELNSKVTPENSAKYAALVNYLAAIGVKKGSANRVVIFSERVATLHWLQDNLSRHLKMPKGAVKIMHGGLSDTEQMSLIDEFKRTDTKLRILITGDVASEGVNLHSQCHNLVHYDIPWSLIRIQQRNGRIDRYGQTEQPQITTLLLDPAGTDTIGELHVLTKLMDREHAAHSMLGDASSLMGEHSVSGEEDAIRKVLQGQRDFDQTVATPEEVLSGAHARRENADEQVEDNSLDIDALLASLNDTLTEDLSLSEVEASESIEDQQATAAWDSIYTQEVDYLRDALNEAFHNVPSASLNKGGVDFLEHSNAIVELSPTEDLRRRLDILPQDYLSYRKVKENLMLATTLSRGNQQLTAAREGDSEKSWPKAHYLGPLHPVSDWAADRALSSMNRNEIPAVTGEVAKPTVLLMGTLTNSRGQVVTRAFITATAGQFGLNAPEGIPRASAETIPDPVAWLNAVGLGENAINTGTTTVPEDLKALLSAAVTEATSHMDLTREDARTQAEERTQHWSQRAEQWDQHHHSGASTRAIKRSTPLIDQERSLLKSMTPERTLIRPLLVVIPQLGQEG
ncbi:DEAD/DEAH box helicase [Corynebacterium alimapuense]|uniref:Helicase n=1 Tax=Corynebacterium alimapuense TaxID=1576874 RepID=A0A3M8K9A5_9CORY|nr:DEAD/DEAH box helicase [Corynebacterium alimapuense]RNE49365.1 helicase [Corynebacterium alimapuense]